MTVRHLELAGEHLAVPERMIVAPAVGVFRPAGIEAGALVDVGDIVGVLEGPGTEHHVRSAFSGTVMGVLAQPGERLRIGQPIAWMRVA